MASRAENWFRVLEHHCVDEPLGARDETPERWAAISEQRKEGFATTHRTQQEAFDQLADSVLDGWSPYGVYDLDEGRLIEVHVSTPIVTVSEDQGVMVSALDEN